MPKNLRKKSLFTYEPAEPGIDAVDVRILRELQQNPRLTMAELGRRVDMSSPSVTERVRRLEDKQVVRAYRVELDAAKLGLPLTIYVRIRPNPGQLPKVVELAEQILEIVECHRVTGEDCFIIKAHIPAMDQLDRLLDQFLLYGNTTTSIVQLSPVSYRPVPLPDLSDLG